MRDISGNGDDLSRFHGEGLSSFDLEKGFPLQDERDLLALVAVHLETAVRRHLEIGQHRPLQGDPPHLCSGDVGPERESLPRIIAGEGDPPSHTEGKS